MLVQQARAEFGRQNFEVAHQLLTEGLALLPDRYTVGATWAYTMPALIYLETGRLEAAVPYLRGALELVESADNLLEREEVLVGVAEFALAGKRWIEATVLHGAAEACGATFGGLAPEAWIVQRRKTSLVLLRAHVDQFEPHWDRGKALTYGEAVDLARTFLDEMASTSRPGVDT